MSKYDSVFDLLRQQLLDPDTGWSVGSFGAIGEFMREPEEAAETDAEAFALSVVTARGGLRLVNEAGVRAVAYENANARSDSWSQSVALCLPEESCRMSARGVLTELGPDTDALRKEDRCDRLFDLGLGQLQVDACVRSGDDRLIAELRRHNGRPVLEPGNPVMERIMEASPHRVFLSRIARAEVFQVIPPPDGRSPEGPHSHILPKLLHSEQTHAATAPIPEGWVPVAHFFPAHPAKDLMGREIPFDAQRHTSFQALLERYGVRSLQDYKQEVLAALRCEQAPPVPADRFEKAVLRATRAQWSWLTGT